MLFVFLITTCEGTIFFIRHCDKPENPSSPCCSDLGYVRSQYWSKYLEKQITSKEVHVFASGYNSAKQCIPNVKHPGTPGCQHSQRMFLTANFIVQDLQEKHKVLFNSKYCIGDTKHLLKAFADIDDDIVVVWDHQELMRMINAVSGTSVKSWPNLNAYDLIFIYRNGIMEYDCYALPGMNATCPYEFKEIVRHTTKVYDYEMVALLISMMICSVAILVCTVLHFRYNKPIVNIR